MAIVPTLLTQSYSGTNATSYTTASVTLGANNVGILVCAFSIAPPGFTPYSGNPTGWTGLATAWSEFAFNYVGNDDFSEILQGFFCVGGASPTTSALTMPMQNNGDGTTATHGAWIVLEITGQRQTNPLPQDVSNGGSLAAGTSNSLTLASAVNAASRSFGAFAHTANEGTTPGSGFTELGDVSGNSPNFGLQVEWHDTAFQTTVDASWATSTDRGGLAWEIAAAPESIPPRRIWTPGRTVR